MLLFLSLLLYFVSAYAKEKLYIKLMFSSGSQRDEFVKIKDRFQKLNPDINVIQNEYEQEIYKKNYSNYLLNKNKQNDVLFWFAGTNLKSSIRNQLILNLDKNLFKTKFTSGAIEQVTQGNQIYALPLSYYQWGFYYNKRYFAKYKLSEPKTWEQFLSVCKVFKENGLNPVAFSGKFPWTLAGWFDYFNLRLNGIDFHRSLLAGKISYEDPRVKNVFSYWKLLLDQDYLSKNATSLEWRQSLNDYIKGNSAMYFIGNFAVDKLPLETRVDTGFFRFPIIDKNVPIYEEAPMDVLLVTSNSIHRQNALKFIGYVSQPEVLEQLNESTNMISPNMKESQSSNYFIRAGWKTISEAKAVTQFFDRDQELNKAQIAMDGFQKFVANPLQLDAILKEIQSAVERPKYK